MNHDLLFGLGGDVLVAVIAGLLFVEEAGVPLFFAPGDLLLGLGGVAIASGRVSAVVFVPAAFVGLLAVGSQTGCSRSKRCHHGRASHCAHVECERPAASDDPF